MWNNRHRKTLLRILHLSALLVLMAGCRAEAHKAKVFATADGRIIRGYAYFTGGARIRNAPVLVRDRTGKTLTRIATDGKGEFAFRATERVDHILTLQSADGHTARWVVPASEIAIRGEAPASAENGKAGQASEVASSASVRASGPPPGPRESAAEEHPENAASLREEVRLLREQLIQYRRELNAWQSKIFLHDILGGIGYILGFAGLAYYLLGRRESAQGAPDFSALAKRVRGSEKA